MRARTGWVAVAALAIVCLVIAFFIFEAKSASDDARPIEKGGADPVSEAPRAPTGSRPTVAPVKPRPFSESEPAEGSATRGGALEIEVIGPTGKLASGARLVLHREREVLGLATTNGEGIARLKAGEGEAQLIILPDGAPMHATTVSILAGRRRVQLPAGVSIAGRVEVDGQLPRDPVTFRIVGDDNQIAMDMSEALQGQTNATCTTTVAGQFEYAGVPEGSEWRILPSTGYRVDEVVRDAKPVFVITAPATGVVVKLTRLPMIRGRVVSETPRAPLAGATCRVHWTGPLTGMSTILPVEADGRFHFCGPSQDPAVHFTRIVITVRGPKEIGERQLVLEPPPERDLDVGDLVIPAGRVLRFVVHDPAGAPIEGASARTGSEVEASTRTDAQGRGAITVGAEKRSFRVGALKYEIAEVPIPDPAPEVLPVTLAPTGGLEVTVLSTRETPPPSLRVQVSAESEDVTVRGSVGDDPIHVAAGATNGDWSLDSRGTIGSFTPTADGRVVIPGLRPAVPLTVAVVDSLGGVHASADVTLGPAEWKTVELRVTRSARSLRGRVRDAAGRPIGGARVLVHAEADAVVAPNAGMMSPGGGVGGEIFGTTDATGLFVLSGIFATTVHLSVHKEGFSPLIRRSVPVSAESAPLELILHKGCDLTVKVVEADGTPIRDLNVFAEVEGYPKAMASSKEPGVYGFVDFPMNVSATIRTEWADREWTRTVSVKGDQTERITMPQMGKVVIQYSPLGQGLLVLELKPVAKDVALISKLIAPRDPQASDSQELAVSPGDYVATLVSEDSTPIAAPERVTVRAGETTRVVLRKP